MATADMTALPLQQFIASLDSACLPKIVQVCSGVYFQGSIYELSGSEVCFSTGDLIKVIGIELLSVSCEDVDNHQKFELPITHTGLFKVVREEMPYSTVEEMISLRPVGLETSLPFTFISHTKLTLDNFTLGAGRTLTVLYIEHQDGEEDKLHCQVRGQQETTAEVSIPLSLHGEFSECESEECFTLQEIVSSPYLLSRRFYFVNTTKSQRPLHLTPIYQVQAIMNYVSSSSLKSEVSGTLTPRKYVSENFEVPLVRHNILKFPSSLEVDVVDVTELCEDVNFMMPLSLTEVFSHSTESFPSVVKILESAGSRSLFKCSWLPELIENRHLVLHKTGTSAMVVLSSLKSRKAQQYFLVSELYGGRFRRRPREFNSAYELYVASLQAPGLKVTVTRNSEEVEEEGLPALSVGELIEVVRHENMELPCKSTEEVKQPVEVLLCQRHQDPEDRDDNDDDDEEAKQQDEREEIVLPLYMQGHFVEVLADNKKYSLKDLCGKFQLPLDVKVVSRDAKLKTDPLAGLTCVRVEGAVSEPTILASLIHSPENCFEIPTQWISMSVSFTSDPLPWPSSQPPEFRTDTVTQVSDLFFYEFCKGQNLGAPPPPRPPKRNLTFSKSCKKSSLKSPKKSFKAEKLKHRQEKSIPTKEFADLTLNSKRRPPAPPPPDMLEDHAPPIVPRKHSAAETISCKALPNTYVRIEESKKKALTQDLSADLDSDHDYETINETLVSVVKKAQEDVMFY